MELTLIGKRVLVTGASSGLGLHFAEVLARAGAEVTLAARRFSKVQKAAEKIRVDGYVAEALELDVTDKISVTKAFSADPYDVVINNAGISGSGRALEMKIEEFESVLQTNLTGVFAVAQAAAQQMSSRGGSIINIASILGLRVAGQVSAYAASKAGIVQLTKALALEWARHQIRVNALCPGYIETPFNKTFLESEAGQALICRIPQRRLGQLSDLDAPLLLLASDASAYMTGSVLVVDGGHLVSSL
jgi:NAD(P)-dependent dehydrogenase (short-subunit alcohol dehydrogenase family)